MTDRKNVKAYYRKSMCYKATNDLERAFDSIKEARKLSPTKEIDDEYQTVKKLYDEYLLKNKEKEKLFYSNISKEKPQESEALTQEEN